MTNIKKLSIFHCIYVMCTNIHNTLTKFIEILVPVQEYRLKEAIAIVTYRFFPPLLR